jgi:hypothetical protein
MSSGEAPLSIAATAASMRIETSLITSLGEWETRPGSDSATAVVEKEPMATVKEKAIAALFKIFMYGTSQLFL